MLFLELKEHWAEMPMKIWVPVIAATRSLHDKQETGEALVKAGKDHVDQRSFQLR